MVNQHSHVKTRQHFPQVGTVKYPLYHDAVETPPVSTEFQIGDVVTFTNDYGVPFPGIKVTGFSPTVEYGRFVYLDYDCYWFPAKPENLVVTKRMSNDLANAIA